MLLQSLLRPVLTPLMRGMFDAPIASSTEWSPLALWPNGIVSPGMWIDPSLLTASFNDSTGTTPVATPGSVADSANPVGLALDIRAGAPTTLGPELITNGDMSSATGWAGDSTAAISGGVLNVGAMAGNTIIQPCLTVGKWYKLVFSVTRFAELGTFRVRLGGGGAGDIVPGITGVGTYTVYGYSATDADLVFLKYALSDFDIDNISVKEIPVNHMLQATSAARPLESAYDGQTLGPGNTYDATGYPVFQLYDGIDDSMATASFAAGTLINGMDCMIAVRRDSAANVLLMYSGSDPFLGCAQSGSSSGCTSSSGAPTVWVDGVQLAGGTAVTRDTLHAALTPGAFHILEFRGADLSHWTSVGFGAYTGYLFNGARGDIMLFPSTASTEDKDAARQYLADKYGVTLP